MQVKDIPIAELIVDASNFRIGEFDSQREAIKAMLLHQGQKIVTLANDILDYGLNPSELLIVTPDPEEDGFYLVCEGNRRVTALKTMESPVLAVDTPVEAAFKELGAKYSEKPVLTARCVVLADKAEAMMWISRRHTNKQDGRGIERWDPQGQGRYEASIGAVRRSKAVMDYLRSRDALTPAIEAGMRRKTTTADRVLNMPLFVQKLGVQFDKGTGAITFDNGDETGGTSLLVAILIRMASEGFNVNEVRSLEQREKFIESFVPMATTKPAAQPAAQDGGGMNRSGGGSSNGSSGSEGAGSTSGEAPSSSGSSGGGKGTGTTGGSGTGAAATATATSAKKTGRPSRSSLNRKTLAPTTASMTFKVKEPRLGRIYVECRKIKVGDFPNAAGVLLRVFVELSTDAFLVSKNIALPAKHISKGRSKWTDIGISLDEKIRAVVSCLDPSGKDRDFDAARKAGSDRDALHSIDTLHGYIHSSHAEPDEMELKKSWERWQPYLMRLHDAL